MTSPLTSLGGELVLGLGIEDTCVYPADPGRAPVDEHDLTGHAQNWAEDLERAADLGAATLRYGVSWPLTHIGPGRFDWRHLDPAIEHADRLGLSLIADLVHYGTPRWLPRAFAEPGYPDAVEEFTAALLSRYHGHIHSLTPLNEPLTTASFCGLRGVWPPYLTGWAGWVRVAVLMALGIARTTAVARQVAPQVGIVHVEAATLVSTTDPHLDDHARFLTRIGWLPTDLALGRVTPDHSMYGWLLDHGAGADDLAWLAQNATAPDVLGVNYYPDLTPRRIVAGPDGPIQVTHNRWTDGLVAAIGAFATRYELPLAITETSIEGDDDIRTRWVRDSVAACRRLRSDGVDLRGYTWWPLLDFIDWSWAAGGANVEEFAVTSTDAAGTIQIAPAAPLGTPDQGKGPFLRRMGLVRLDEAADGSMQRHPTFAASQFRHLAAGARSLP